VLGATHTYATTIPNATAAHTDGQPPTTKNPVTASSATAHGTTTRRTRNSRSPARNVNR
jgi:hypothetical protein